jgi:hypothetical protein
MSAVTPSYCSQYAQRLPIGIKEAAITSFTFSFAGAILLTFGNIPFAFAAGTWACVASLIDSLVRPILEHRPGDANFFYRGVIKISIIYMLTALAGPPFWSTASLATSIVCSLFSIIELFSGLSTHPYRAQCYCIV